MTVTTFSKAHYWAILC